MEMTNHPTSVDAIWAMRNKALDQSNHDRRYGVLVGRKTLTFTDRMTGKSAVVVSP